MYENYQLDISEYDLTKQDKRALDLGIYIVDNNCSIRKASKEFCISKSQAHRDVTIHLRKVSFELYKCVQKSILSQKEKRKWNSM